MRLLPERDAATMLLVEMKDGMSAIMMTPLEKYWLMQFVHHVKIETAMSHKAVISMQAIHDNLRTLFPPDTH